METSSGNLHAFQFLINAQTNIVFAEGSLYQDKNGQNIS